MQHPDTYKGKSTHLPGTVMMATRGLSASLRMRIMYCVILVSRCLFLCTKNLGQCARCSFTCSSAFMYFGPARRVAVFDTSDTKMSEVAVLVTLTCSVTDLQGGAQHHFLR